MKDTSHGLYKAAGFLILILFGLMFKAVLVTSPYEKVQLEKPLYEIEVTHITVNPPCKVIELSRKDALWGFSGAGNLELNKAVKINNIYVLAEDANLTVSCSDGDILEFDKAPDMRKFLFTTLSEKSSNL